MKPRTMQTVISIALVMMATLAIAASSPAGATIVSWARQATVNPAAQEVWLSAVSCGSAASCEGVGYYVDAQSHDIALAEHWNGSTWTRQPLPAVSGSTGTILDAVSCAAASNCEAVGSFSKSNGSTVPLAERWNGVKWTAQATPAPLRTVEWLTGVSCVANAGCEAVGISDNFVTRVSFAERWNGLRWSRQTTAAPAGTSNVSLGAVSCVSASSCEAVGNYRTGTSHLVAFAERWNGVRWAYQAMVNPTSTSVNFNAVSCVTSAACEAVGSYMNSLSHSVPLAERWNGSRWVRQTNVIAPTNSGLNGVSCVSTLICEAVGGTELAERWNGSTWTRQTMANSVAGSAFLPLAVACVIRVGCESVGMYSPGAPKSMAERYRG